MKLIDLVRRATELSATLRARRGGTALAPRRAEALGQQVLLGFVHASTTVARKMQQLPIPPVHATERVMMTAAAAGLRELADVAAAARTAKGELAERDGDIEVAMAELVRETLTLVDHLLKEGPQIDGGRNGRTLREEATPSEGDVTHVRF